MTMSEVGIQLKSMKRLFQEPLPISLSKHHTEHFLKIFLHSGYSGKDGDSLSNTSVKEIIASIVEQEDISKPLSDRKIVDLLAEKDIKLARRTVAKYREELGIPPTNLRRRY